MALCTVSGNLASILGANVTSGTVRFTLMNIGSGNTPTVTGSNVIVPLTTDAVVAADGSFSVALQGNDTISPAGTFYAVTFYAPGGSIGPNFYSFSGTSANLNSLSVISSVTPPVFVSGGNLSLVPVAESASFTASLFSTLYLVTTGSGAIVATLPTAVGFAGQSLIIKKVDSGSGTVVLTPSASQKIDGLATFTLSAQFQYLGVVSDGTNWQIFTRN